MSTAQQQWLLDPTRNEWYYCSRAENAYVYQNGRRIPMPSSATTAAPNVQQATPRTLPTARESSATDTRNPRSGNPAGGAAYGMSALQAQMAQVSVGSQGNYNYGSSNVPSHASGAYSSATRGTAPSTVAGTSGGSAYHGSSANQTTRGYAGGARGESAVTAGGIQGSSTDTRPQRLQKEGQITDPRLAQMGVGAKGMIRGTYGDPHRLYPEYQVRKPGKKFFKRGKVFKVLWPEILGQVNDSVTVTSDGKFGESIATKIRWFIVVMEGKDCCTCLPINTYGGKGVAKKGVVKWHHAIAYSTREEPAPQANEEPGIREQGPMMVGVRIKPRRKSDKLHVMSRIDFARMYTVEHNVKVYDFGEVHKDSMECLVSQWLMVIQAGVGDNPILPSMQEDNEDDDNDSSSDDGNDDDDDDDDDEDTAPAVSSYRQAPSYNTTGRIPAGRQTVDSRRTR